MKKSFCKIISRSMSFTQIETSKSFGGCQNVYSHFSNELQCDMKVAVYLPPSPAVADSEKPSRFPVLYHLNGLTANEENFIKKSGMQRYAAEHGLCVVCPDTSPRNIDHIPGVNEKYDIGYGAGFYVDATEPPWNKHFRMYSYVTSELVKLISDHFPVQSNNQSISGHSMGGHGALICALKNPKMYKSVSAFAPVANISNSPLAPKAFTAYLGSNRDLWYQYDATELVKNYRDDEPIEILIDQGNEDDHYKNKHLLPENFLKAASKNDCVKVDFRMRDGYNHSHFFVATFVEEHIKYHAKFLNV